MIHVEQHGHVLAIRLSRSILGRPFWWTTAYWVDGLLIDSGPRFAANTLLYALRNLHVDQIVLTHTHEDQTGGLLRLLQQYPKATVYASPHALRRLRQPEQLARPLYRRLIWGRPQPCRVAISLDSMDNLIRTPNYRFRVVETPGHTPDHIALFEPHQRWLFSGDVFIYSQTSAWTTEADLFGVISSLRTLAELRPERLFPSDGRISRTPLPELHGQIGHWLNLTHQVARLDALGFSKQEMVMQLFQKESPLHFWTLGHYSATNLIEACRSYNALFTTFDYESTPAAKSNSYPGENDSSDSSSGPIDWEDLIR